MKNSDKNGFTLAELLIVVVVMGILAAVAFPMIINSVPKIMANKYKSDALVLMNDINLFFSGNKNSSGVNFTPFSAQEDIFCGARTVYFKNDGTRCEEKDPEVFRMSSYPLFRTTHHHWICGSYDPDTDTWENNETEGYSYVYTYIDSNDSTVSVVCQTAGEYFLRCIYGYGEDIPASEVKFPTYNNGSKLYITFEQKNPLTKDEENKVKDFKEKGAYLEYIAKNDKAHPVGIISIKSSDPLVRTLEESKKEVDHVYYTYEVGNWPIEEETNTENELN